MNTVTPLISVVIPCYNDGVYLPETIAHLKKQTFKDFEIIIVNDGSTDASTLRILEVLSQEGIMVLHKENGRMSSARNYGVKHAKGELIAALDADDYFHPTFFEKAIPVLQQNPQVAVVTSYIQLFGELKKVSKPRGGNEYNFLFSNQCPACAMVRKSCWIDVGGYDEAMVNGYEDWEFYIRITQKGWTVHVIPEKLFFYRQTLKSTHKNYTLPNRPQLVSYIVDKHRDWYLQKLKELITNEAVVYRNSRVSYPIIAELLKNRITGKHQ
jgi:glycosyltransferase involved in cell wall biosynthesis